MYQLKHLQTFDLCKAVERWIHITFMLSEMNWGFFFWSALVKLLDWLWININLAVIGNWSCLYNCTFTQEQVTFFCSCTKVESSQITWQMHTQTKIYSHGNRKVRETVNHFLNRFWVILSQINHILETCNILDFVNIFLKKDKHINSDEIQNIKCHGWILSNPQFCRGGSNWQFSAEIWIQITGEKNDFRKSFIIFSQKDWWILHACNSRSVKDVLISF